MSIYHNNDINVNNNYSLHVLTRRNRISKVSEIGPISPASYFPWVSGSSSHTPSFLLPHSLPLLPYFLAYSQDNTTVLFYNSQVLTFKNIYFRVENAPVCFLVFQSINYLPARS
jgi:hypothetical protein